VFTVAATALGSSLSMELFLMLNLGIGHSAAIPLLR